MFGNLGEPAKKTAICPTSYMELQVYVAEAAEGGEPVRARANAPGAPERLGRVPPRNARWMRRVRAVVGGVFGDQ